LKSRFKVKKISVIKSGVVSKRGNYAALSSLPQEEGRNEKYLNTYNT
jgi:hypothetical protein